MKLQTLVAITLFGFALSGCATVMEGSTQTIRLETPPVDGAKCLLSNREGSYWVLTPGYTSVSKSKTDLQITCSKDGYKTASASIPSDFESWTIGNIIIGGVVGVGVDAATGAIHNYPYTWTIPMEKLPEPPPPAEPQHRRKAPHTT